ncbi:hypothetical protein CHLNCDRAFT_138626 [Chlorella variabilis]|uniref:DNL-type domain-containing protein n=1 Tax=Chlorella variabilis TaxID=554065 RepID=E1ZNF0_CHLVA|nr:hypothetical protein CHLNCDRAFT_138626 [Chlorella variabilis]EFN52670.1 hypothetical protein CHLNCDRAFT_138626 [Chlorella variabilis]|eukprot:XP_005844772.1 hypothetical protein CHLNCDRAFT_138626 [Chlorella variabilis]
MPQLRASAAPSSSRIQQNQRWQRRQQGRRAWPMRCRAAGGDGQQQEPQPLLLSSSDEPGSTSSGYSGDSEDGSLAGSADGDGVSIDLHLPRRSLLVKFTCNLCSGRSERLVNPVAWNKGMVIAQCQHCQAWHKLADAANLVEEIRYADLEDE